MQALQHHTGAYDELRFKGNATAFLPPISLILTAIDRILKKSTGGLLWNRAVFFYSL